MKHMTSTTISKNSSVVVAALLCLTSSAAAGDCASYWAGLGPGVSEEVFSLAVHDDGRGPTLYAGGFFITAGEGAAFRVARWDGQAWSPLGRGLSGPVAALASFDTGAGATLIAGGQFSMPIGGPRQALRIAQWDGRSWNPLGDGLANCMPSSPQGTCAATMMVATLLAHDGDGPGPLVPKLYAGGNFLLADGAIVNHIAVWDGTKWSALGSGMNHEVYALASFAASPGPPSLHAAGRFSSAGGTPAHRIARWSGTAWSAVGTPPMGVINVLVVFDDGAGAALYAGGATTGSSSANGVVARWSGADWSSLDGPFDRPVLSLAAFDDGSGGGQRLYAGGNFTLAGGVGVTRIARWDGAAWSAVPGFDKQVNELAALDDGSGDGPALYAGGQFTHAGGINASRIAKLRCPGAPDLNGDGVVNGVDLALLLAAWGPCPAKGACAADLDGSGVVSGIDLAIMLGQWG